jgi:hypothetical protein
MIAYEAWDGGTDGRDSYLIGRYKKRSDAERAAKGRGTMGYGDGAIYEIGIEETYENPKPNKKVVNTALKKLTKEEKAELRKHFRAEK